MRAKVTLPPGRAGNRMPTGAHHRPASRPVVLKLNYHPRQPLAPGERPPDAAGVLRSIPLWLTVFAPLCTSVRPPNPGVEMTPLPVLRLRSITAVPWLCGTAGSRWQKNADPAGVPTQRRCQRIRQPSPEWAPLNFICSICRSIHTASCLYPHRAFHQRTACSSVTCTRPPISFAGNITP